MSRSNLEIARVFSNIATMLEMDGGNPFRIRAYAEAAHVLETQAEPLAALAATEGALEELPGIGKDLAGKIRDVVRTGTTEVYEELQKKYPLELVDLTRVPGLGPKRVRQIFDELKISDREALAAAARAGQLRDLPRFGEKLEAKVLAALAGAEQAGGRMLLATAWPVAHALAEQLAKVRGVKSVELAGSFRRRKETIGDLDILVTGGASEAVMDAFTKHSQVIEVLGRGDTKSSVRLASGLQVDLRHVPEESFGAAMLYFSGSKQHNIDLRKIAIDKGWSLNEYGLTKGERVIASHTEEDIYRKLEMPWIPPELRETPGIIEQARAGGLPKLIEEGDIVADLHMHSDRSDGQDTLEAMVRAAKKRGYAYCAITEHSQSLAMAQGFDTARVRKSVHEIEAVRKKVPGIEVLHGLEVDILADGELDLDDEGLAMLDWVIVSLHSQLDRPGPEIMRRVLRALEHPRVNAMGHPTGRLIGSRPPSHLDLDALFTRAAELGVAMEINGQPDRTDLSDLNARFAHEKGVRLVINTDAHAVAQLDFMKFGVFAARRAGLEKDDVLNTKTLPKLREAVHRPAGSAARKKAAAPEEKKVTAKAKLPAKATKRVR